MDFEVRAEAMRIKELPKGKSKEKRVSDSLRSGGRKKRLPKK